MGTEILEKATIHDEVWHAGDWGDMEQTSDKLCSIIKVRGVFGNIDGRSIRKTYPEELFLGQEQDGSGSIPIGYRFPSRFLIKMFYNDIAVATKLLPCYLENFSTTYNATSMGMHKDGNFQEVDISMTFRESRTLSRADISEGKY